MKMSGMLNWSSGKKPKKEQEEEAPAHPLLSQETVEYLKLFEKPAETLLSSLSESIEDGSIGTVLGVDASGRLPGNMLGHMLTKLYETRGHAPPFMSYLPSGQYESGKYGSRTKPQEEAFQAAVANLARQLDPSRKILIVDDAMDSGRSVEVIARPLLALGFKVEVAAFSAYKLNRVMQIRNNHKATPEEQAYFDALHERKYEASKAGNRKEAKAIGDQLEEATARLFFYSIPLHIGLNNTELNGPYPGTSRIPGAPQLPPYVEPPGVTARVEIMHSIADEVVARYEASRGKASPA